MTKVDFDRWEIFMFNHFCFQTQRVCIGRASNLSD